MQVMVNQTSRKGIYFPLANVVNIPKHDNLHQRPLRSLKWLMKILWHDVMMLCTKQKCKVVKTSKSCKKSKLLDNEYKQVMQGIHIVR